MFIPTKIRSNTLTKNTSVTVPKALVEEAKAKGLNVAGVCKIALKDLIAKLESTSVKEKQ